MPAPNPFDQLAARMAAAMSSAAEAFRSLAQPGSRDMLRYVGEAMGRAADDLDARLAMAHGEWRPHDELAWQPFTADELETRVTRARAEGRVRAGRVWAGGPPDFDVHAPLSTWPPRPAGLPPREVAEAALARWDEMKANARRGLDERDILDRIDDATLCGFCGMTLRGSVSDQFCGSGCQSAWHADRVEPLTGYVEPLESWATLDPYGDDALARTQRTGDLRNDRADRGDDPGVEIQPF